MFFDTGSQAEYIDRENSIIPIDIGTFQTFFRNQNLYIKIISQASRVYNFLLLANIKFSL